MPKKGCRSSLVWRRTARTGSPSTGKATDQVRTAATVGGTLFQTEHAYHPVINGNPDNLPQLDPEDLALLSDPTPSSTYAGLLPSQSNGVGGASTAGLDKRKAEVAWLRRTEYFGDATQKVKEVTCVQDYPCCAAMRLTLGAACTYSPQRKPLAAKRTPEQRVGIISRTFVSSQSPLADLRHPSKPHLRPTASYPLLPNPSIWGNTYQMCRFTENPSDQRADPGAVAAVGPDPRLETAFIRPVVAHNAPRMVYYLPRDEDEVRDYKRRKVEAKSVDELAEGEEEMEDDQRVRFTNFPHFERFG